jgi:hypothetical protein
MSFDLNVEIAVAEFKTELTDMQCVTDIRNTFWYVQLLEFYKIYLPTEKVLALRDCVWQRAQNFSVEHAYLQFISISISILAVNGKFRNLFSNESLES